MLRVQPTQLDQLLHPVIDPAARATPVATGLPASPGAASGMAVFDPDVAERRAAAKGERVILVREETTPEDFHGIVAARAVLTARGGMTSHAAVVARGMGKCASSALQGCASTSEHRDACSRVNDTTVTEGDWITLDGATGRVFVGDLPTMPSDVVRVTVGQLRAADSAPAYQSVRAAPALGRRSAPPAECAPTPTRRTMHASRATSAPKGIGLCRTEHMFFEGDRITAMREMIVARDEARPSPRAREAAPDAARRLRGDLRGHGRLSGHDPPARSAAARVPAARRRGVKRLARPLALTRGELAARSWSRCARSNPMLGHRGCRLGITYPEITEMQGRAIFEAAVRAKRRGHRRAPGDHDATRRGRDGIPATSGLCSRRRAAGARRHGRGHPATPSAR